MFVMLTVSLTEDQYYSSAWEQVPWIAPWLANEVQCSVYKHVSLGAACSQNWRALVQQFLCMLRDYCVFVSRGLLLILHCARILIKSLLKILFKCQHAMSCQIHSHFVVSVRCTTLTSRATGSWDQGIFLWVCINAFVIWIKPKSVCWISDSLCRINTVWDTDALAFFGTRK